MSKLSVENVSLQIKGNTILSDISASIKAGELIGIIGPNGAGKSSLLKCILGLVEYQSGFITYGGKNIVDIPLIERAKILAYSAQGAPVHWPLTVENIVALGRLPHMNPWRQLGKDDECIINTVLGKTDTEHLKHRSVMTLSGGERARVLLARTLSTDSKFIMADEPTASLDPSHQLQVLDILRDQSQNGKGVCIVLHDLSMASRYCDKLLLLHEGHLVAHGTPDEVLSDENLERVFSIKVSRWKDGGNSFLMPIKK